MAHPDDALHAYYARDKERERLSSGVGLLEFVRTLDVIGRTLPSAPATVADIGGGPGRYTDWLVEHGYRVVHRDLVAEHVANVRLQHPTDVDSAVGDARALDLPDASVDHVLLLGPLYHLSERADRVVALREAGRVVRPGGRIHVAAITRWAARLHGILLDRVHEAYPAIIDMIDDMERTGWMAPLAEASFTGYAHTPREFADEIAEAELDLESLVAVEGMAIALGDLDDRLADPHERDHLLHTLRAVEDVPDLLGIGPHLLATARSAD
jgi:SAM-dependent methyltransferase